MFEGLTVRGVVSRSVAVTLGLVLGAALLVGCRSAAEIDPDGRVSSPVSSPR